MTLLLLLRPSRSSSAVVVPPDPTPTPTPFNLGGGSGGYGGGLMIPEEYLKPEPRKKLKRKKKIAPTVAPPPKIDAEAVTKAVRTLVDKPVVTPSGEVKPLAQVAKEPLRDLSKALQAAPKPVQQTALSNLTPYLNRKRAEEEEMLHEIAITVLLLDIGDDTDD